MSMETSVFAKISIRATLRPVNATIIDVRLRSRSYRGLSKRSVHPHCGNVSEADFKDLILQKIRFQPRFAFGSHLSGPQIMARVC